MIKLRAKLLQKYLKDEQKELQALYALQALMMQMEQPASEWLLSYCRCLISVTILKYSNSMCFVCVCVIAVHSFYSNFQILNLMLGCLSEIMVIGSDLL